MEVYHYGVVTGVERAASTVVGRSGVAELELGIVGLRLVAAPWLLGLRMVEDVAAATEALVLLAHLAHLGGVHGVVQ